jgi:protein-L-isoaspartate(D-aspartate) O-methyltransferase
MDFRLRRQKMVDRLAAAGVQDPAVLRAFLEVPRHLFVEEALMEKAYGVHALPIGFRQTISQPEIAARMTEMLQVGPEDRILEVGTGSGYQAAILARLASEVLTLERIPQLARRAERVLLSLEIGNIRVKVCDGSLGLGEGESFDGILVAAAAPEVPRPLLQHLCDGGRMVIPVGSGSRQNLLRILRQGSEFLSEDRGPCTFVKLIGRSRWANLPENPG